MAEEGMRADPDDMIVTTGGQQVIDLVTKTLVDPGDVVICEAPTYPGAVPVFSSYEADVVQIEMDSDGMRIDLLEETLERLEREKRRPKFIYTVPTFQNPAGVTLSEPRRKRLVEIARERELLVLEDNPYGLLRYEGEPLPPLYALDGGEYVLYLGTFSKILSPGIRLGWLVAPDPVLAKVKLGKQAADLCTSSLTQQLVDVYFEQERWRQYIETCRASTASGAMRCSTRSPSSSRPRRSGPGPAAGCSSGRRCPTSSTRTTCSPRRSARSRSRSCPAPPPTSTVAAAARCASTSRAPTRTRSARASSASARWCASRSRSTGPSPATQRRITTSRRRSARTRGRARDDRTSSPRSCACPSGPRASGRASVSARRVAVLKGGPSLERQVSLRSAARVEDALEQLGHEVVPIDVDRELVERLRESERRRRVRGAARTRR